jgi:Mg2+-importing ATPase
MKQLNSKRPLNSFQRGIRHVTYMMIAFMLVLVPIVSIAGLHLEQLADFDRFW